MARREWKSGTSSGLDGNKDAQLRLGVFAFALGGGGGLRRDGHYYGVCGGWVVAEPKVEAGLARAGKRKSCADEAFRHVRGVGEVGVGGDLLDEVEIGAGKCAGLGGVSGAVEIFEDREADEGDELEPVTCDAFGRDRTYAQGTIG